MREDRHCDGTMSEAVAWQEAGVLIEAWHLRTVELCSATRKEPADNLELNQPRSRYRGAFLGCADSKHQKYSEVISMNILWQWLGGRCTRIVM